MNLAARRPPGAAVAGAVLVVELAFRVLVGHPYPGATGLLLVACAIAMHPLLPGELRPVLFGVAALPALTLAAYSIVLTTVSIAGISLTELTIRLTVYGLVGVFVALGRVLPARDVPPARTSSGSDLLALAALGLVIALVIAVAWDISGPYPSRGTDWGHYLLYADEVAAQGALLIDDPFAGEPGQLFPDGPGIGAVYGSFVILDGVSSKTLSSGIALVAALAPLGVWACAGALWGVGAALVAASVYAVAPVRIEILFWYGLHTLFALALFPLLVFALALMCRGSRGLRVVYLLALVLAGIAVFHSTSAVVAAVLVAALFVGEALRAVLVARPRRPRAWVREWWRAGPNRPLVSGVALAFVLGAGVIAHLLAQSADRGRPLSYEIFEPDWLTLDVLVYYFSWVFLGLVCVAAALVLTDARLRHDPALRPIAALVVASVVVGELWRLHFPFEYRRAVYYAGVALVLLIGVASVRLGYRAWLVPAYLVLLLYMGHASIGLRLPERILEASHEKPQSVLALERLRQRMDDGEVPNARTVVADECVHFVVPYLLRRRTISAVEPWQVAFEDYLPVARRARTILEGGEAGARLARRLRADYVVVDPRCTPDPAPGLGGQPIVQLEDLTILRLPRA